MQTPSSTPTATLADPPPPNAGQLRQALDASEPGDSPRLPRSQLAALDDGIADQQSRRSHRPVVVTTTLVVLAALMFNLTWVVCTMVQGFHGAIASAPAQAPAPTRPGPASLPPGAVPSTVDAALPANMPGPSLTALRDGLTPLVALVSILTLAVVFLLGTMLKAAFATPQPGPRDTGPPDAQALPITEALRDLLEWLQGLLKKG